MARRARSECGDDIQARLRTLRTLGHPYSDAEIESAPAALEGKTELDAVVAYLQALGRFASDDAGRARGALTMTYLIFGGDMFVTGFMVGTRDLALAARQRRAHATRGAHPARGRSTLMASIATGFWAGWVAVITIVSVIGLAWLVVSVYFSRDASAEPCARSLGRDAARGHDTRTALVVLDDPRAARDVSRLSDPLPRLRLVRGVLRWSQGGQIAASLRGYEERFGPVRDGHRGSAHARAATGSTSRCARLRICSTITAARATARTRAAKPTCSRTCAMTAGNGAATSASHANDHARPASRDAAVASCAQRRRRRANGRLRAGARQRQRAAADSETATAYRNYCSACHGADGAGMPLLGAPALNDERWLYGGSLAAVRESISRGRTGVMPPFGERLDGAQIKLLTAWLASGAAPLAGAVAGTRWPVIARIFPFAGSGLSSQRACL